MTTVTVTNTGDGSPGSLRDAINQVNLNATGPNEIDFAIQGTGVQTITPGSALPAITAPVFINGYSQPGSSPNTLDVGDNAVIGIALDGGQSGGSQGLVVSGGAVTIRGLAIGDFALSGIDADDASDVVVAGDFVGVDTSGTTARANGAAGVQLSHVKGATIGGATDADRNIISGNKQQGLLLTSNTIGGNSSILFAGNYVGTNAAGTGAIPNGTTGVDLGDSPSSTIGGTTVALRNVVSGNADDGILVSSASNVILGNFIGTDATGTAPIPNSVGVQLVSGATLNQILGNVISGNNRIGIAIEGANTSANVIAGNKIGVDVTGTAGLDNFLYGVVLDGGTTANTIGGPLATDRNVISGNAVDEVDVQDAGTSDNVLTGNYVGVDATGQVALGPGAIGVSVFQGAPRTLVLNNVISGSRRYGLSVDGADSTVVRGNFIGTDASGTKALPNVETGLFLRSTGATIGGTSPGQGNLISGNTGPGASITGTNGIDNLFLGNRVGTDATGNAALPNSIGLVIEGANNTVGGTTSGSANLISGNLNAGIQIRVGTGSVIQGNRVGTNLSGTAAVPNGVSGIVATSGTATIGGTTPGAGNLLSGNTGDGIDLQPGTQSGLIQGNLIGTDATGLAPLGNSTSGLRFQVSGGITVGGTTAGAGNVFAADGGIGAIEAISGTGPIQGNLLGVGVDGTTPLGNLGLGIALEEASHITFGGTTTAARNIVANNANGGIQITGAGELIEGNLIAANRNAQGSLNASILVVNGFTQANSNTIGGTTPGAGNTITGSPGPGVAIGGGVGNAILSNSIYDNGFLGIDIDLNQFGSPLPNDPQDPDTGPNNLQNYPVITDSSTDGKTVHVAGTLNSTPNGTFLVQFFADDGNAQGLAEGRVFLGQRSVTTDGSGNVAFAFDLAFPGISPSSAITSTATDSGGNTSEFSLDTVVRNANNSGFGSLRQAISNADLVGEATTIRFNVPSDTGGPVTIAPTSPLPAITSALLIDGYTQPGAKPNDLAAGDDAKLTIVLDGRNAGSAVNGLTVSADGVTIRGLVVQQFTGNGIQSSGHARLVVAGDFIGTDATGSQAFGNEQNGIQFLGTSDSTIGGTAPADRNLVSGNTSNGIVVSLNSARVVVANNYVGTDANGLAAIGNLGGQGIVVDSSIDTTVGGSTAASRNVVSGNGYDGIRVLNSAGTSTVVRGNFAGTNRDGLAAITGQANGVEIDNIPADPAGIYRVEVADNVLSGIVDGLILFNSSALVRSNHVGTDPTGSTAIPNRSDGISLQADLGSSIGGPNPGDGNTIAFNGGNGIGSTGSVLGFIRGNAIFGNAKLGIDIGNDGVTPNRPPTPPTDPNRFPNYPVLNQANNAGGNGTQVAGSFDGTENSLTTLDFFSNPAADPSGFGQGQGYLGSISFTTNSAGHADFTANLPAVVGRPGHHGHGHELRHVRVQQGGRGHVLDHGAEAGPHARWRARPGDRGRPADLHLDPDQHWQFQGRGRVVHRGPVGGRGAHPGFPGRHHERGRLRLRHRRTRVPHLRARQRPGPRGVEQLRDPGHAHRRRKPDQHGVRLRDEWGGPGHGDRDRQHAGDQLERGTSFDAHRVGRARSGGCGRRFDLHLDREQLGHRRCPGRECRRQPAGGYRTHISITRRHPCRGRRSHRERRARVRGRPAGRHPGRGRVEVVRDPGRVQFYRGQLDQHGRRRRVERGSLRTWSWRRSPRR